MIKIGNLLMLCIMALMVLPHSAMPRDGETSVHDMGKIEVTAKGKDEDVHLIPSGTFIDVQNYRAPGVAQNISDILKDRVIIDFRGESDLVPDDDTLYMRGYSGSRFSTAIDSLTIQKSGGRKSSHIVDYALLPTFLIESIEILPGPHSARYPGKSIGGVINLITKSPQRRDTLKPDVDIATSYRTYDTLNHTMNASGGVDSFVYDLGYQKYLTNGYLRHNEADIETFFGRFGYILPSDGFLTLSTSYTDADRQIPVNNDPGKENFNPGDPMVANAEFDPWQNPTWDKEAYSFRLIFNQPTSFGNWSVNAYTSKENRQRNCWHYINRKQPDQGTAYTEWETEWWQHGGRIEDEIRVGENHLITVGFDTARMYDNGYGYGAGFKKERIRSHGGYFQHQWHIIPRLSLTAGLRYEDIRIWVQNYRASTGSTYITGRAHWIERHWDALSPKSFLTYELDDLSEQLRDTSVSIGVSRIWHAPDFHGTYNGQAIPSGAWLDPEHGIGFDFVVTRRLFKDIHLRVNYSYSEIEDYFAYNRKYAEFTPGPNNPVTPGLEYRDYQLNLDKVIRQGLDVEMAGHLYGKLSFSIGYAFQDFDNRGGEPGGEEAVDQRAKHRVNANLCYDLLKHTQLLLGYEFQDDQITERSEEVARDVWVFKEIPMDAFHVFDVGIQQTLFHTWGHFKGGELKFYISNLFDESYETIDGYPATDRTYGILLTFSF